MRKLKMVVATVLLVVILLGTLANVAQAWSPPNLAKIRPYWTVTIGYRYLPSSLARRVAHNLRAGNLAGAIALAKFPHPAIGIVMAAANYIANMLDRYAAGGVTVGVKDTFFPTPFGLWHTGIYLTFDGNIF